MNILVTGATGFVGNRFIQMAESQMKKEDKLVLLTSKQIEGYTCILHENYSYDADAFKKAGIDKIDKVIHIGHFMAEKHSDILPVKGNFLSIKNTQYLIEHLPNMPEVFVYCSIMGVYGVNRKEQVDESSSLRGEDAYAVSKIMIEMLLHEWAQENHVRLHILRLAHIYGPGDMRSYSITVWLKAVWQKEPIRLFVNPGMYRNCVYIDDCCKALWAALSLQEDIEIINLVSEKNYTMGEIAQICREVSGNGFEVETDFTRIDNEMQCGLCFKNNDKCRKYLIEQDYDLRKGLKREFAYYERHMNLCGDINSQFVGKKLLILAANAESIPIVRTAQQMGIYTIVTDHIVGSPAKKVADKYFDVDGKDVETLVKIVEQEQIDGILLGCADPLVPSYVSLCKRTEFPCYIQESVTEFVTNKKVFKQICAEAGIPVGKFFFAGKNYNDICMDKLEFPVIVKPMVGRGGRGVSLCKKVTEIKDMFERAKRYSDNGEVMLEEYFDCEEVTISYLFCNGVPYLLGLTDRDVLKKEGTFSAVTYGNFYPSEYTHVYIEDWHEKFCRLLRRVRIRNGLLNIQMFVRNGKFYPYDPNGILNAELSSVVYPKVYQINLIQHFIEFALTGNMQMRIPLEGDGRIPHNKVAASIWILLNPGKIKTLHGRELLENNPSVLDYVWRLEEGAVITEEMAQTEKATLARVWISTDDREELQKQIAEIRAGIKVFDEFGNDLVYR